MAKKRDIELKKREFATMSDADRAYDLKVCNSNIDENKETLKELIYRRTSTPTNDEGSVNACENMKKLLEAMKGAKMNEGVIDLRKKLKGKGIAGYYDEAEVLLERNCYKDALEILLLKSQKRAGIQSELPTLVALPVLVRLPFVFACCGCG